MSNMETPNHDFELDLDDLEGVAGGCIVVDQSALEGKYFIIRDDDGMIYTQMDGKREDAIGAAHDVFRTSDEIITPKEYAQRCGRPLGKY